MKNEERSLFLTGLPQHNKVETNRPSVQLEVQQGSVDDLFHRVR